MSNLGSGTKDFMVTEMYLLKGVTVVKERALKFLRPQLTTLYFFIRQLEHGVLIRVNAA